MWICEPSYANIVSVVWSSMSSADAMENLMGPMERCAGDLCRWNREKFWQVGAEIHKLNISFGVDMMLLAVGISLGRLESGGNEKKPYDCSSHVLIIWSNGMLTQGGFILEQICKGLRIPLTIWLMITESIFLMTSASLILLHNTLVIFLRHRIVCLWRMSSIVCPHVLLTTSTMCFVPIIWGSKWMELYNRCTA